MGRSEDLRKQVATEIVKLLRSSTRPLPGKLHNMNSGSRSQWYAYGVEDSAQRVIVSFGLGEEEEEIGARYTCAELGHEGAPDYGVPCREPESHHA